MGTGEEAVLAESSSYIPFQEDENRAYTYEVPVEALDRKVKCAAWSTRKEKWYDRDIVFLSDRILKKILQAKAAERGILKEQTVVILFSPAFPTVFTASA